MGYIVLCGTDAKTNRTVGIIITIIIIIIVVVVTK